jgi:hypothetical protein
LNACVTSGLVSPGRHFIFVGLTITDTFVEGLVLRTGAYAYPGGIRAVERGIDRVKVGAKGKQAIKFFAIYGSIHLGFVVLYMIPQQWFATHFDPFPEGYKSSMINDMCAEGADGKTCPGPGVLMPRP